MVKKRKLSGLSGAELAVAYHSLRALRNTLQFDMVDEEASVSETETGDDELFVRPLETLLFWMGKKLEQPQPYNFSGVDAKVLTKHLHLEERGSILFRKHDPPRLQEITALQPTHVWSSENLSKHLTWLEQLVPENEVSARSWIDAFFFRTSAMVSEGRHMVNTIPTDHPTATTILAGQIDYSAIVVAKKETAEGILMDANMMNVCRLIKYENTVAARETQESTSSTLRRQPTGFFVVKAKPKHHRLNDYLPQTVAEMYACATLLHQRFLRGALTNGHDWIFIIIRLKKDGAGGNFKRSSRLSLEIVDKGRQGREVNKESADRIAAVLSYWIEHSFEDIGDDDWFEPVSWKT